MLRTTGCLRLASLALAARSARLLLTALALSCTTSLLAQAPSAWSALTPPGVFNHNFIRASKLLAMYREGGYLRVFSGVTGRWHTLNLSIGTTPQLYGEMLVIPESDRWTAFSAYRSVPDVLFFSAPAVPQLVSMGSWALVRIGATAHVFSAFTGRWHAQAIPADWLPWIGDRYLVFTTPNTIATFDATAIDVYTGQRHDLGLQNAALAGLAGSGSTMLLTLRRPDTSRYYAAFSSLRPSWVFDQGPGMAGNTQHNARTSDLVTADDRSFSGLTGTFAIGPAANLGSDGMIADSGSPATHLIGQTHNAFVALPPGAVERPGSAFRSSVQLFSVPGQTIAFDALVNQLIAVNVDPGPQFSGGTGFRGAVAATRDAVTGLPSLFSALTHRWYPAPAGVRAEMPALLPDAAAMNTTTGVTAFAARSGRFVPLNAPGLVGYVRGNSFLMHDGSVMRIFDQRTERWLTAPSTRATVPSTTAECNVALMTDPGRTTAYGRRSGRLESVAVSGTWDPNIANGDVVAIYDNTQVVAFTGLPENLSWFSFPSSEAACGIGTTWRSQLRLRAGSGALIGLGLRAAAPLVLPPFGEVWLDPGALDLRFVMGVPGEERVVSELSVPAVPALRGSEWWQQSLILPATGTPYVTDVDWLWIL